MIAAVYKEGSGYIVRFERDLQHPADEVWSWLTNNEKLSQWFSELRVEELKIGGFLKFDMGDGTFERMEILDLQENAVIEYTWGRDIVRFELIGRPNGCKLILIEKIKALTDHTPKDLAGWHVCLDVISALLDDKSIAREEEWKQWYEKYQQIVEQVQR